MRTTPIDNGDRRPAAPGGDAHVVQFYDESASLVDGVVAYLADGLMLGQPCVIIAREPHGAAILQGLAARGFPTQQLTASRRIVVLDAHEALSRVMIVGSPSPQRFTSEIGGVIATTSRLHGNATVRAYGEMVDILWSAGNTTGALRLEDLWNGLAETHDFVLLCGYAMGHFLTTDAGDSLQAICDRHTAVRSMPAPAAEPAGEIGQLTARIAALEQMLRERDARARELEAALLRLGVRPLS